MADKKLSNEIVSGILTRLPPTSVTRFKCVSKTWNSIISTPKFISSYISHNSSTWFILDQAIEFHTESEVTRFNHNTLLNPPNINTLSINPHLLLTTNQEIINTDSHSPALILTSSNGLMLFSIMINRDPFKENEKNPDDFYSLSYQEALFVGNPITLEWVPLPLPIMPIHDFDAVGFITRLDSNGVVDKFLVVEYQVAVETDFSAVIAYFMCFSSDTGKWVHKTTDYRLGLRLWRRDGVFEFANRLVWFDLGVGINVWDEDSFDFMVSNNEKALCRFVSLPRGCERPYEQPELGETRSISGNGGFIQYLEVFEEGDDVLKVWRLKGFGLEEEGWSLMYNVSRVDFESCGLENSLPCVCFSHPFEVDVAFFKMGGSVVPYNFRSQKVDIGASVSGHERLVPIVMPSWPTSVPLSLYAALAKESGNQYCKEQNFVEAIKSYSRSISLSPNALAFANRAMAYIKVGSFRKAEEDCTEAISLDRNYFKIYGRRAVARKELGNFEGCLEDIEYALKLEPNNKEMIKMYEDIKTMLEKTSAVERDHEGPACNVKEDKQCTD